MLPRIPGAAPAPIQEPNGNSFANASIKRALEEQNKALAAKQSRKDLAQATPVKLSSGLKQLKINETLNDQSSSDEDSTPKNRSENKEDHTPPAPHFSFTPSDSSALSGLSDLDMGGSKIPDLPPIVSHSAKNKKTPSHARSLSKFIEERSAASSRKPLTTIFESKKTAATASKKI